MSLIKTEKAYHEERARYINVLQELERQEAELRDQDFAPDEIARMLQPLQLRCAELKEQITLYDRIRNNDLSMIPELTVGQALIVMRIAKRLSQQQLAGMLEVDPSQISRDEANEYRSANLERLTRVADAVGIRLHAAPEGLSARRATKTVTNSVASRSGFESIPPSAPRELPIDVRSPSEEDRSALRRAVAGV